MYKQGQAVAVSFSAAAKKFRLLTRGRRFYMALAGVVLLALLLRAGVSAQLYNTGAVQRPNVVTDMATYQRLAAEVRAGKWPEVFDYQPFYYTVFLPLVTWLSPAGRPWPVVLAQVILGSAAVWLTGLGAARVFGRRAGIMAALLLALSRFHIFYTPYLLLEVLQSFWMALIFFCTLTAWNRNRRRDWCLLALFCACSTLTRGNALLFVPGLLALLVWRNWRQWGRMAALCGLFLLLFYLPQLPYSWRNYQATGRWCGPSVAQDKVLALGNTPEAPAGGLEYPRSYHYWCGLSAAADATQRVSVSRQVWRWLRSDPLTYLELKFRTLLLFWDRQEIPNNVDITTAQKHSWLLRSPLLINYSLLGSLGLAGMLLCLRRLNIRRSCLLYAILAYCLGTVAFYMLARFRIGCLPLLCIAAGGGIRLFWAGRQAGEEEYRQRLHLRLLLVLAAVFMVNSAYGLYHRYCEPALQRSLRPGGLALDFPQERVIYDHGPLSVGGRIFLQLGEEPLVVEKIFAIPEDWQAELAGQPAVVWLQIYAPEGMQPGLRLTHAGQEYYSEAVCLDRLESWCRFRIPSLQVASGEVRVIFHLRRYGHDSLVAFDTSRRYQRTWFHEPTGEKTDSGMELFAELAVPQAQPAP
jgi:4-amino-4-deoxy-L-arabinose transferase-like glycosyltransferase